MKGIQITSLSQLVTAAREKKAVTGNHGLFPLHRPYMPASFIASMQGMTIHRIMLSGLWIYEGKRKEKKNDMPAR